MHSSRSTRLGSATPVRSQKTAKMKKRIETRASVRRTIERARDRRTRYMALPALFFFFFSLRGRGAYLLEVRPTTAVRRAPKALFWVQADSVQAKEEAAAWTGEGKGTCLLL